MAWRPGRCRCRWGQGSGGSIAYGALGGSFPLYKTQRDAPDPMGPQPGYTKSMKTAVSIPDDVFRGAERLARRTRKSRSPLYSEAVKEYVARHATDEVTETLNRVCDQVGDQNDPFLTLAARRILQRSEW